MFLPRFKKEYRFIKTAFEFNSPLAAFEAWFNTAKQTEKDMEPNAMCLSTCNLNMEISSRFVLMKYIGPKGFMFFTNFSSDKARDISENRKVATNFYWPNCHRSVRIQGTRLSKIDLCIHINY